MNLFRFLKSTKGAIKPLNALLISGAAGVVFAYTVNTAANKQIQAERAVRSLTSIEGTAPQQGLRRQGELLTSINVRDGRNQVATTEERAAMKGNSALDRYEANQRALGNMESSLGRAAQFSESEGLNTGNRNAVQSASRFIVGNSNANTAAGGYYAPAPSADGSAGPAGVGGGQPQQLANASMAHASGNAFGGTSGSVSGANSGSGSTGTRAGGEGPARLSGAMPGGSNIVSQRASAGLGTNNHTSSFGRDRDARTTRGSRSKNESNELRDIVSKSAAAARRTDKDAANEGGRAFMASAVNSGGVSVTGSGEDPTASSSDLAATDKNLRAVGRKLGQIQDEQEERSQAQKALSMQLLATVLGSLGMIVAGALVLSKLDHDIEGWELSAQTAFLLADRLYAESMAKMYRAIRWLIAAAMMAAVAGFNGWLMANAIKFIDKYGSSGGTKVAVMATVLAPVLVAGMVFTAIKPAAVQKFLGNVWSKVKSALDPVNLLVGQATSSITGMFK